MRYRHYITAGAAALAISMSQISCAQEAAEGNFDVAAQELKYSLRDLARQAGLELVASSDVLAGKRAPALRGHYSLREALNVLLAGSDLTADIREQTIFIRGRGEPPSAATADASEIVVTGSLIRGNEPASPMMQRSRVEIERAGYTDLGAYARSIPQNFSGGQNPGVVSSVQPGSENFNSSSTLNLRGLGPDATLTLLNGHRLAYDAVNQGIDISSIPLIAVERVEIVPDGASALYGSDAVGGVANIILRKDYDGVLASARFGAATSDGDVQQQYSAIAGHRWASGGFAVAGDFSKSTDIAARQRTYTNALQPAFTLLPSQRQLSGVVVAHQSISDGVRLSLDAHVNDHRSLAALPFTTTLAPTDTGVISTPKVLSYSISPALSLDLAGNFQLNIRGTRAGSDSKADAAIFFGGTLFARNLVGYNNKLWSGQVDIDGPLFALPGGDVRIALGGGARAYKLSASISQLSSSTSRDLLRYKDDRTVTFGYGELSVPVAGPANAMPGVQRLILSGAVRYEHYSKIGGLATPKLGIIYDPIADVTVKASWGRSFKAPTLAQLNQAPSAALISASEFFPAAPDGRNILLLSGGSPALKPEKASAWSLTAEIRPSAVPGFRLSVTRFAVRYRDRVVIPIPNSTQAFVPIYQALVLRNPTIGQVLAATTDLPLGVDNQTADPFDPALVGAIISNQSQNAASQHIKGVDLAAGYELSRGSDRFSIDGSASYLQSNQRLSAGQPAQQRAGTIFNPPHWRGQISGGWSGRNVELTAAVNYIGGTTDSRATPSIKVDDFISLDATMKLTPMLSGFLAGVELLAVANNIFNEKPSFIRTTGGNSPPFDATNYSSIGRLLSLTVVKRF